MAHARQAFPRPPFPRSPRSRFSRPSRRPAPRDRHHPRWLWILLFFVAATLSSPGAAGTADIARAQRVPDGPSHKLEEAADEAFKTYVRLLERYRVDDEGAARDLASFWTEMHATHRDAVPLLLQRQSIRLALLAEMAFTDLALDAFTREDVPRGNAHLEAAEHLIDVELAKPSPGERQAAAREQQRRFARDWYHAVIWLHFARLEGGQVPAVLRRARDRFPDDPELLLSSGTYEELEMTRLTIERHTEPRENRGGQLQMDRVRRSLRAMADYRQAIAMDPTAAEARVRLAYALMRTGDHQREEALTLLHQARAIDSKPPLAYLAALFAGAIEEERKQFPAAGVWYRTAIATCPRAQTSRLAYSHLQLEESDNLRAAQSTLRPLIGGPPRPDSVCEPDPWRLYEFGQAWRLDALITAMRKQVREPAEGSEP
jgi:tetratricopeptide (TPR) repeat protein